ncbi:sugar transferase [Sulfitobacter geojensis]|uniref:sugar transferase n=1 Tax=Sulfitobacter geojensis TaxID=1342299 RepID=UPI00046AFFDA|nr:sugar transferase [Sulfitobacter geojensis]NYI27465.1 lipopolysaccharide/colanic/teichoic acid biosynthesis glycosyltransferase [Sulfitobacter geojensis]
MIKYFSDRVLSIFLIPALLLCIPALIAIRLESPGNPLFLQTRVGKNQRPFTLVKLRTMAAGTAHKGSHEVSAAQITRIGAFLRKTKIDELPQIWNVLMGDMSFVGPRPNLPNQSELIAERARRGVYDVRPGITGPAQLTGIDMSTPVELATADAAYIANQTFCEDLKLILQTGTGGGRGDAVKGA